MSELTSCIEHVRNMMSKTYPPVTLADIRPQIVRLFEEGVTMKPIVDLLVARQHELHEEMVLGLRNHDHLSPDDFKIIERTLGVNELTPENREHWEAKFRSGLARYWCPQCGYAGNDEFPTGKGGFGSKYMWCYLCGHLVDDPRYFTRSWTPEEQKAHEAQRDKRRAELEAKRIAEGELKKKRDAQIASVRSDAVKATREIELHQWLLNGDDEDAFSWDEHDAQRKIRTVIALMLRPLNFGRLPIPADDVVAYFKQTMKDSDDDLQAAAKEFNRCAQSFDKMTMEDADND
jgi:hypothetical protein